MRKLLKSLLTFVLLLFVMPMILSFSAGNSAAQPLECPVSTIKVAPGAEGEEFQFNGVDQNGDDFTFFVTVGETSVGVSAQSATITEVPVPGWKFAGIECKGGGLIITDVTQTGWSNECVNPNLATFCIITNVPVNPIPTISQWGMISAAAGLVLIGVFFAVRRKRAQAV